jgi:radical SAM protein with 4Fe4S-binding SPASM domain
MPLAEFERIISKYRKYMHDCVGISHHGECFLYPHIDTAIFILKKYNVPYSVTTNGSLLGNHLEALRDYPPQLILFSLYTLDAKKFKQLTKTGELSTVVANIGKILDLKKCGAIKTKVYIRAIKMFGFESDIAELTDYFRGKDVEFDINFLNSWAGRVNIARFGNPREHTVEFKYCIQPWAHCVIGSDLGVYICNNHEDNPIGYLYEQALEDIWNSPQYLRIRRNILLGNFRRNEICSGCDYLQPSIMVSKPLLAHLWGVKKIAKRADS